MIKKKKNTIKDETEIMVMYKRRHFEIFLSVYNFHGRIFLFRIRRKWKRKGKCFVRQCFC